MPGHTKTSQRNAQATRQRIVDAACVEFAAAGLAGARVDRIAAAAGCNKSLIFVHFENKAALFGTVVAKELERLNGSVDFASNDVRQLDAGLFDFAMKNPSSMRLLCWCGLETEVGDRKGRDLSPFANSAFVELGSRPCEFGTLFSANSFIAAIVALATAWSQGNPVGQVLAFNENGPSIPSRETVVEWVARLVE